MLHVQPTTLTEAIETAVPVTPPPTWPELRAGWLAADADFNAKCYLSDDMALGRDPTADEMAIYEAADEHEKETFSAVLDYQPTSWAQYADKVELLGKPNTFGGQEKRVITALATNAAHLSSAALPETCEVAALAEEALGVMDAMEEEDERNDVGGPNNVRFYALRDQAALATARSHAGAIFQLAIAISRNDVLRTSDEEEGDDELYDDIDRCLNSVLDLLLAGKPRDELINYYASVPPADVRWREAIARMRPISEPMAECFRRARNQGADFDTFINGVIAAATMDWPQGPIPPVVGTVSSGGKVILTQAGEALLARSAAA